MLTAKAPYLSQQTIAEMITGKDYYYFYFLETIKKECVISYEIKIL